MNVLNRFLVILFDLAIIAAGTALLLIAVRVVSPEQLAPSSSAVVSAWLIPKLQAFDSLQSWSRFQGAVICALVILFGLLFLYLESRALWSSEPRLKLKEDTMGTVTVALKGVRDLVNREVSATDGVLEVMSQVKPKRKGLFIQSRISVAPSVNIVELGNQLQEQIKTVIENHLSYPVSGVSVNAQIAPLKGQAKATRRVR